MSHVFVVNSAAKSIKINTTPTKYLTEVRNEACKKWGLKADLYTLKYNNKPISLSQQIRLANLAQGARLELVQASRSPTVITVALQLPVSEKNTRLTQKFASNSSLWEILRQFESGQGANYNFTQRGVPEMASNGASGAGRLNYEMPVITVMPDHKVHETFVDLQKTLSQLGFDNGSALLRLSFKNSGTPLEEAMAQITQYFKSADSAPSGAQTESSAQAGSIPGPEQAAPEATATVAGDSIRPEEPDPSPMEVDKDPIANSSSVPTQPAIDDSVKENIRPTAPAEPSQTPGSAPTSTDPQPTSSRNIQVFSAPTSSTPQAARQKYNEADYVPTVEHAKSHQAALGQQTKNQRLLSDAELEKQEQERQEKRNAKAEKGGILRIRFPDGSLIQTNISKADTAEDIHDLAAGCLDRKNEPFQLQYRDRTGRPVKIERNKKRVFQDLEFSNSELITFLWEEGASFEARQSRNVLSPEWQQKAQKLKVDEPVASGPTLASSSKEDSKAEGKKRGADMSSSEKENKIKNLLKGSIFKKK